MNTPQRRQAAGTPVGGQFAPTHRPAPTNLALVDDTDELELDELDELDQVKDQGSTTATIAEFPSADVDVIVPQANSVSKIAAVVDAVAAGCVEASDIAEAIGVSRRQGAYYPHAAESLGLLEQVGHDPMSWDLTPTGHALFTSRPEDRAAVLAEIIADDEHVACFVDDGPDALASRWPHLSPSTVERRLATIASWVAFAYETSADEQSTLVAREMTSARELAPTVRSRAEARRAAATRPVRRCPSCNLELPSGSDVCDTCS